MSNLYKGFCSNPECDYVSTYNLADGPSKFCTKCGSKMINKCPKCDEMFNKEVETFCPGCGAKIKESK